MWNNYFMQIKKKYSMKISTKNPLVINLDGKDVTKNININILEKYKGSFFDSINQAAQYFSQKYECFCIVGADEISFIIEEPIKLIKDINSDNDTFVNEIVSIFSQYFYNYFNSFYEGEKVFWHGKCYSINESKIKSFIKYKSKLIHVLTTTYFLKKNGMRDVGKVPLEEKIIMCNKYVDYIKIKEIEIGTLYYKGKKIDINEFLNNDKIDYIEENSASFKEEIEFEI